MNGAIIHIHVCIYVYIYIGRERERERDVYFNGMYWMQIRIVTESEIYSDGLCLLLRWYPFRK